MKQITNPLFFHCCSYTKNYYWKEIFENLAYGIPPTNFTMTDTHITYKNDVYWFTNKTAHDVYHDLLEFFSVEEKIKTESIKHEQIQDYIHASRATQKDWASLKKHSKLWFIENVCVQLKVDRRLTRTILCFICTALFLKSTLIYFLFDGGELKDMLL